jgi:predicted nucleotidyltransferase component of viral defense system
VNKVARMPARERAELFAETAERKALAEAIIEKDFWVCWVLKQLFSIDAFNGRLLFKGGTSLSKIFHTINRNTRRTTLPCAARLLSSMALP